MIMENPIENNMETIGVYRNIQCSVPDLRLSGFGVRDLRFGVWGPRFGTQEPPILMMAKTTGHLPYSCGSRCGSTWIYIELPDNNQLQQESPRGPLR